MTTFFSCPSCMPKSFVMSFIGFHSTATTVRHTSCSSFLLSVTLSELFHYHYFAWLGSTLRGLGTRMQASVTSKHILNGGGVIIAWLHEPALSSFYMTQTNNGGNGIFVARSVAFCRTWSKRKAAEGCRQQDGTLLKSTGEFGEFLCWKRG